MYAAHNGHTRAVKVLIAAGADAKATSNSGYAPCAEFGGRWPRRTERVGRETALMGAARNGHAHAIKLLIAAGADVDAKGSEGYGHWRRLRRALTY